jgi:HEAT repeats
MVGCLSLITALVPVAAASAAGPASAPGIRSALRVLEAGASAGSPRLQQLAFTALSEYYCRANHNGEDCTRLVSQGTSHSIWEVRLMNLSTAFRPAVPERLRQQVVEEAVQDSIPHLRRAAAKLLSEHPQRWARRLLEKLTEAPDVVVREHAAAALVRLGRSQYASMLEEGLRSTDREAALEAAQHVIALKNRAQAQARTLLKGMLKDGDEVTRANAIYGLSELESATWDDREVERLLTDDSAMVRAAMISAAPMIRFPKRDGAAAFGLLVKRWPEENATEMRVEILNAVAQMEGAGAVTRQMVSKFVELILQGEQNGQIKLVAMGILAGRTQPKYGRELLTVARDPHRDLTERLISLSSLGQCRDATVIEPLARMMEEQMGDDADTQAVRISCAAAIVRLHASQEGAAGRQES